MTKYKEYKGLNLPNIASEVLIFWKENKIFEKSIETRSAEKSFVFYEGPPSANGLPGIHHVMGRTIKDIFCRYKTLQGFQVKRKAGWDTHGLPVELGVEKALGITKEDIGKKISVDEYNQACRTDVMKYTGIWNDLTEKMGYWVDMQNPYVTYDNKYIESVWVLLKRLHSGNNPLKQSLLYKGYTIQPYSPAAGTGLSTHELNQPGCYRNVKDRTAVAMFKVKSTPNSPFEGGKGDVFFLAWTTTPWTLPSNTALAVGEKIDYVLVKTFNPYTYLPVNVILAKNLMSVHFSEKNKELKIEDYKAGDKNIPFEITAEFKGKNLAGTRYEQLLPFVQPTDGDAFKVIVGDFVTTEDGTGIVHLAPSFGADDFRVAKQNGIGSLTLVDKRGKFVPEVKDGVFLYGEEYVKEAYLTDAEKQVEFEKQKQILETNHKIKDLKQYLSVDERIVLKLQEEGKLFKKETYEHSYPHCWRTDKPVLYYPLDSWFIKTTAAKDRLIELNKTINWKPEHTGTGRFGNWLENLNDWNLSRSRYWGIPLPIWRTEDGAEELCIGSIEELQAEIKKSIAAGVIKSSAYVSAEKFDLHKPYIDDAILVSASGKPMYREADLIDVWFDSGAMPYAQLHYPFENKELIDDKKYFPADFIAEGVDQTRGWFFTLHAIGVMLFDSVAFKNVVSNGLVLDKNGNKMSKRLGNAVDPFSTLSQYGPDATRWYMIANAAPWDNLKFDAEGIIEVQRKLFGTLFNTYNFFAIYANVDGFEMDEQKITSVKNRVELDRWIVSKLQNLIANVTQAYEDYEPHKAARYVEEFVDEHLSNWYIRLSRRRFWKSEMNDDKKAAYETLYECLMVASQLMAPIAPFFAEWMYKNLSEATAQQNSIVKDSIHLTLLAKAEIALIDNDLEQRMDFAQRICSMILSIRKKENIKVRQPLQKVQLPILDESYKQKIESVKELILSEVNVKELEFVDENQVQIVKNAKLNFKTLGKKYGKQMKAIQDHVAKNDKAVISAIEKSGNYSFIEQGENITIETEDIEIIPVDIPGWKVANVGSITVALDISISEGLKQEGVARELVNRIQNIRKDSNFNVTDKILVKVKANELLSRSITNNYTYICTEILAESIELTNEQGIEGYAEVEIDDNIKTLINVSKLN